MSVVGLRYGIRKKNLMKSNKIPNAHMQNLPQSQCNSSKSHLLIEGKHFTEEILGEGVFLLNYRYEEDGD